MKILKTTVFISLLPFALISAVGCFAMLDNPLGGVLCLLVLAVLAGALVWSLQVPTGESSHADDQLSGCQGRLGQQRMRRPDVARGEYEIHYSDVYGNYFIQDVDIQTVYKKHRVLYMDAYCHWTREVRAFRVKGIMAMKDNDTGQDIVNIASYLERFADARTNGPEHAYSGLVHEWVG